MTVSAIAGLVASLVYYFWRGDGIAYTPGVLLVIGSTVLLALASLAMATGAFHHWLASAFFIVATGLDVLGTAFAAWLLEAHWLLALMALAAVGWLIHAVIDAPPTVMTDELPPQLQESAR